MDEVKWFISTMGTRDYHTVAKKIPGFPQDLRNPGELKKQLEEALYRGYKKTSGRRKLPQIDIRDLYVKIGTDCRKVHPHLTSESTEELILKLQFEPKIKPYQQISVLYLVHGDKFESLLSVLISSDTSKNPLEALVSSEPVLKRLELLIGKVNTFEDIIPEIYNLMQDDIGKAVVCDDREQLFIELLKVNKDLRLPILFRFLTQNDNFKKIEYQFLCDFVIREYYAWRNASLTNENSNLSSLIHTQEREIKRLKNKIQELTYLELEIDTQKKLFKELRSQQEISESAFQNKITEFEELRSKYNLTNMWGLKFQTLVQEIKTRKDNYAIITNDKDGIVCRACSIPTFTKDKVFKWKNQIWNTYKNNWLFFVLRNSFNTTEEWLQFTKLLDEKGIEYREVIGYEELGHLAQIIKYLLEDE